MTGKAATINATVGLGVVGAGELAKSTVTEVSWMITHHFMGINTVQACQLAGTLWILINLYEYFKGKIIKHREKK